MKQKSSILGQADVLDDEVRLREIGRGVMNMATSNASLSSGQIVGPCAGGCCGPGALAGRPGSGRHRDGRLPAARGVPFGGVQLDALEPNRSTFALKCFDPSSPSRRSQRVLQTNRPGCFSPISEFPRSVVNCLLVPIDQVGRLEDHHVHVAAVKTSRIRSSSEYAELLRGQVRLLGRASPCRRRGARSSPSRTAPARPPNCPARRSSSAGGRRPRSCSPFFISRASSLPRSTGLRSKPR